MLEIRNLKKSWRDFSLEVELSLGAGEIGTVLGPSGCGKSTFLRLIAGLEEADSGSIILEGRELRGLSPEKRMIGMVFQDYALFPQLSVRRNIAYGPRARGLGKEETELRVEELAKSFGIAGLLERQPASLSGGEQQRVALARALAFRPDLLLLDEPLSSLDARLRERLREEVADRLKEARVSALFVTHDVAEAFAVADRVFLMKSGRIVEAGEPEELYERPRRAYTARFLGRGPVIPVLSVEDCPRGRIARTVCGDFLCCPGDSPRESPVFVDKNPLFLHFPSESCEPLAEGTPPVDNELSGLVEASYFLGSKRRVRIRAGGLSLDLDLNSRFDIKRGLSLRLRLPPERCILISEG